jgi:von Willebrand factor type A domain
MKLRTLLLALLLAVFAAGMPPLHAETNVLFIFDSSGSMKKKVDNGEARMTVAKRAMAQTLKDMPADVRVGLLLYGHRKAKDCADIELTSPIGADDPAAIAQRIAGLKPKGETPIAAALEQAIRSFAALKGQSNRVVLVTDGIEECGGDLCRRPGSGRCRPRPEGRRGRLHPERAAGRGDSLHRRQDRRPLLRGQERGRTDRGHGPGDAAGADGRGAAEG